jgi:transposase
MKKLSTETCDNITNLLDSGLSTRKIATALGVSAMSVSRVKRTRREDLPAPKRGRPNALSVRDKSWVARQITSGKAETATEATKALEEEVGTSASPKTVRRALKEVGLKAIIKQKKPKLSPHHIKARYEFALKHKDWTVDDWKCVIFSDETKINRLGSDGRRWAWKKPGSQLENHHVAGTVKFGGGSLMIWGCMTYHGVGYMCKIDGHMDAELYRNILAGEMLETIKYYRMNRDEIIFQQDNDPKHTSRIARQWFVDNSIRVLEWPAQSPDLNPIEHLWWHLKKRLNDYEEQPKGMLALWERIEKEWNAIQPTVCVGLIESMPRRIAAVLKAKGGYIKY